MQKIQFHPAPANKPATSSQPTQGKSNDASTKNGAATTESDEREAGFRDFLRTIKRMHAAKKTLQTLPKAAQAAAIPAIDAEIQKVINVIHQWVNEQIKDAIAD